MPFHIEAYPQGFPHLAVPVHEQPNANSEEHATALAIAAAEATNRLQQEYPSQKIGAAIVFACHDARPAPPVGIRRSAPNSVVY